MYDIFHPENMPVLLFSNCMQVLDDIILIYPTATSILNIWLPEMALCNANRREKVVRWNQSKLKFILGSSRSDPVSIEVSVKI